MNPSSQYYFVPIREGVHEIACSSANDETTNSAQCQIISPRSTSAVTPTASTPVSFEYMSPLPSSTYSYMTPGRRESNCSVFSPPLLSMGRQSNAATADGQSSTCSSSQTTTGAAADTNYRPVEMILLPILEDAATAKSSKRGLASVADLPSCHLIPRRHNKKQRTQETASSLGL